MWHKVDPDNLPMGCIVAMSNDDCGAEFFVRFDDSDVYHHAEDGFEITLERFVKNFSYWTPAPEGVMPHFTQITESDWD